MPLGALGIPENISTVDDNDVTDSDSESSQSNIISARSDILKSLKRKVPSSIAEIIVPAQKSTRLNQKNSPAHPSELDDGEANSRSENDRSIQYKDPERDNERLSANPIQQSSTKMSRVKKRSGIPYRVPDGFEIASGRHRNSPSFDVRGKKLWHIVAPRSFSLSAISEFHVGRRSQISVITSNGGIHHDIEPTTNTDVNTHILLLPNESRQTYYSTSSFDDTFHFYRSRPDSEQFLETGRLSLRPASPHLTAKAIRKQQEGLKLRHWATGFEDVPLLI